MTAKFLVLSVHQPIHTVTSSSVKNVC